MLPRHTAKPEIRGGAVWSVLAPGSTSISVTVRLIEEERKQGNLLSPDLNGELLLFRVKYRNHFISYCQHVLATLIFNDIYSIEGCINVHMQV